MPYAVFKSAAGNLRSCSEAHNSGNILGSGSHSVLLMSAEHEFLESYSLFYVKESYSLRTSEFMSASA